MWMCLIPSGDKFDHLIEVEFITFLHSAAAFCAGITVGAALKVVFITLTAFGASSCHFSYLLGGIHGHYFTACGLFRQ